ncbi:transcription intermediary factor 1-alpha isoform X2 [Adelges cooleyi]|uniref:transcription intermediary factor 1-alpha isoform X2 n=1 Tax=Adelges cooleyi TaxID=133065 RepID=UPI00217FA405|nr:transcription intermediary factor 1-alpha isoform X2 [Adelges cooleyi]
MSVNKNVNDKNKQRAIQFSLKCIFCNGNGDSNLKMLECLHLICDKCVGKEVVANLHKLGKDLECICEVKTLNGLVELPFKSLSSSIKKNYCNIHDCNNEANFNCTTCKELLCASCATHHMSSLSKIVHGLICIPENSLFCTKHSGELINMYCDKCFMMACSQCLSVDHKEHPNRDIEVVSKETKFDLSSILIDIEKNNKYMEHCLKINTENICSLSAQKKGVKNKIDLVVSEIKDLITKRGNVLKKQVDETYEESLKVAQKQKQNILNTIEKNVYYSHFTNKLLDNNENIGNILKHRKIILTQLERTKNLSNIEVGKLTSKIIFDHQKSFENVISDINNFGTISLTSQASDREQSTQNLSKKDSSTANNNTIQNNLAAPSSSCPMFPKNDVRQFFDTRFPEIEFQKLQVKSADNHTTDYMSDIDSSDDEAIKECAVCCQGIMASEKLVECCKCQRIYHPDCHVPKATDEDVENSATKKWICNLCIDYTAMLSTPNPELRLSNLNKIVRWILLELYCKNDDSVHFLECAPKEISAQYYEKIKNPIALNNIKARIETDQPVPVLNDILRDITRVFENAKSYYPDAHCVHQSATALLDHYAGLKKKYIRNICSTTS